MTSDESANAIAASIQLPRLMSTVAVRPTAVVRSSLKPPFNGENTDVENRDAWRCDAQRGLCRNDVATKTRVNSLAQGGTCALAVRLPGVRRLPDHFDLQFARNLFSSRVTADSASMMNSCKRAAAGLMGRSLRLITP
jgi:hypothetical protein